MSLVNPPVHHLVDLDRCRTVGDPLADDAVAAYFATVEVEHPGALFGLLVQHTKLAPEDQVAPIRDFLAAAAEPPAWIDEASLEQGQDFFNLWVAHHFSAMYLSSLPSSYAAAKGVQVLHMTSRLRTDTERRLNETAQFLMDISAPGAFGPGGVAIDRILHIRLMHAAVRWLITNDPSVDHVDSEAPPLDSTDGFSWSASWGTPVNQEDLVGTLLTFTVVVYDFFDQSGVLYDDAQIDDHLHLWRVIGHHLGIDPALVPTTRAESTELRDRIWHRQHAPSAAGAAMAAALLAQSRAHMPGPAWKLMPAAFRRYLGDELCDMIDLPPTNWTRHLFGLMTVATKATTHGKRSNRAHAWLSERIGHALMNGVLAEMRHGERPPFAIPTHLAR